MIRLMLVQFDRVESELIVHCQLYLRRFISMKYFIWKECTNHNVGKRHIINLSIFVMLITDVL